MPVYKIVTSGPITKVERPNVREAKRHVEAHVPMKRGWISKWVKAPQMRGVWLYVRYNSKGNEVGNGVYLVNTDRRSGPTRSY